jgi:hypothetical protein
MNQTRCGCPCLASAGDVGFVQHGYPDRSQHRKKIAKNKRQRKGMAEVLKPLAEGVHSPHEAPHVRLHPLKICLSINEGLREAGWRSP